MFRVFIQSITCLYGIWQREKCIIWLVSRRQLKTVVNCIFLFGPILKIICSCSYRLVSLWLFLNSVDVSYAPHEIDVYSQHFIYSIEGIPFFTLKFVSNLVQSIFLPFCCHHWNIATLLRCCQLLWNFSSLQTTQLDTICTNFWQFLPVVLRSQYMNVYKYFKGCNY